MKLVVIGAGYVGLTAAVCFAEMGNHVVCVEVDSKKLAKLQRGELPIFEPYLDTLFQHNVAEERLSFVASLDAVDDSAEIYFICVGTPSRPNGDCNTDYVLQSAHAIAAHIKQPCLVVTKSTVPVGTGDQVEAILQTEVATPLRDLVHTISNPEFMKEGVAIDDFMHPDRIILGINNDNVKEALQQLYAPFTRKSDRIIFMARRDAEMTKYVANAMLANRISFMNEMAVICDQCGADIEAIRKGIGSDKRIGERFLYAGCGFGGSCFPKDVSALINMAQKANLEPTMLQAIEQRNALQKTYVFEKLLNHYAGHLEGRTLAVWGLSFKPETDDVRDSSAQVLIAKAIEHGMTVRVYDPVARDAFAAVIPVEWLQQGRVVICDDQYDTLRGAEAVALLTEWKQFRQPDFDQMLELMDEPVILDGRNQYDPHQVRTLGFTYFGIGRAGEISTVQEPCGSAVT